jgi:hypothetical protein
MRKVTYTIDEAKGYVVFWGAGMTNAVAHPIRTFPSRIIGPEWLRVRQRAGAGCPWSVALLVARDELLERGLIR